MRNYALAALAALCIALPARAQQQTINSQSVFPVQSDTTTLLATNDVVKLALTGQQWASAVWVVSTAGNGGITTEYTNDPLGKASGNWLAAPYSKRLDQVTANPSTATWANNTPVAGTFETPLPGNATAFRIRYQTAGTATVIQISAGAFFTPGVPVVATLYDITSGTNSALDTGTLEVAGWVNASVDWVPSGATATGIHLWQVDGAGSNAGTRLSQSVTTPWTAHMGEGGAGASFSSGGTTQMAVGNMPGRFHADAAAVAAQTTRIRIEVRR